MLRFLVTMIFVGIAHFAIGVSLYHQRVVHSGASLGDSDVVVFLVPMILAFGGYFMAARFCASLPQRSAVRIALVVLIAVAATAVSSMCVMTFAFRRWGT
jgi:hypothetical protein